MITGSINVNKIDKGRLFDGKKGMYLDLVLIETPDNEYGNDYMIVQKTDKGEDSIILGNAKIYKKKESKPEGESAANDLPF